MNSVKSAFWYGVSAAMAASCAFQDILGRELYLQFAKDHWISLPWPIGAGLFLFVIWRFNCLCSLVRQCEPIVKEMVEERRKR